MDNIFTPCQIVCLIPNWRLPKLDDVCVYSIVRLKYCMRSKSLLFLGPWCWWETKQHVSAVKAQNNCHKTVFTCFRRWNGITRGKYNWYKDILQFILYNECFDEIRYHYKNVNMVSVAWCKYYDSISYLILHDFYLASFHSLQIFDAALHSSLVLSHCFVISSEAAAVLLLLST